MPQLRSQTRSAEGTLPDNTHLLDFNPITFAYSTKNIPTTNKGFYLKCLIAKTEQLIKNMRWRALYFLKPTEDNTNEKSKDNTTKDNIEQNNFGFKSTKSPPAVQEMAIFESKMIRLIQDVQFTDKTNDFQQKLKQDIKKVKQNPDLIIQADKTSNYYNMKKDNYEALLNKNIQSTYKKAPNNKIKEINNEAKALAERLKLDNRIQKTTRSDAYITLKDHKQDFANNPRCRLINTSKSETGRISRSIIRTAVDKIIEKTKINLWKNTTSVLNWYKNTTNKENATFISFDIVDYYPNITEELLMKALEYANNYHPVTQLDKDIILHCKKTLLFNNETTWIKKDNENFDVTMGSYDGAEVCELVGCYLLSELNNEITDKLSLGLYRDDGLAISHLTPKETENCKKAICKIFKQHGLKITIEANKKIINFLDVTLNLNTGKHQPYLKDGNKPKYINTKSNHPKAVIKAIPNSINQRLSNISSDKETFMKAITPYQQALTDSGHNYKLHFNPRNNADTNKTKEEQHQNKKTRERKRKRNITWYNPPFDLRVKTNIGKIFLKAVKESFPSEHPLRKIFNKNTLKISYSCLPNIRSTISAHNKNKLHNNTNTNNKTTCNCRNKNECPVDGQCKVPHIVYQATVTIKEADKGNETPNKPQTKDNHEKRTTRSMTRNKPLDTNNKQSVTTTTTPSTTKRLWDNKLNNTETYVGLTENDFKTRLATHKQNFKNEKQRFNTALSKHIWRIKEKNLDYEIKWKILGRAKPYSPISRKCNLCILEKYYIICHREKASLNKKSELVNKCLHRDKYLLERC